MSEKRPGADKAESNAAKAESNADAEARDDAAQLDANEQERVRRLDAELAIRQALPHQQNPGDLLWVMSNRRDDRVVLAEQDPRHPGGWGFAGGDSVDLVYRTEEVEALLSRGLLIEVPEPARGRKHPLIEPANASTFSQQPGQRVALGRVVDPELFPDDADRRKIAERQRQYPSLMPMPEGITVPKEAPVVESSRG